MRLYKNKFFICKQKYDIIYSKNTIHLQHDDTKSKRLLTEKNKQIRSAKNVGPQSYDTRGDMLRSVMEGVGYNLDIILNVFKNSGNSIDELILIGGGARNEIWQQILCDVFGTPILVPNFLEEATSMGAAITAGVGVGAFKDFSSVDKFIKINRENKPNVENNHQYSELKKLFDEAYYSLESTFDKM